MSVGATELTAIKYLAGSKFSAGVACANLCEPASKSPIKRMDFFLFFFGFTADMRDVLYESTSGHNKPREQRTSGGVVEGNLMSCSVSQLTNGLLSSRADLLLNKK